MASIEKVSAGGVVLRGDQVLTIYVLDRHEIVLPKGTVEAGESAVEAAIREVYEETGYHTQVIRPLGDTTYEFDENGHHYAKTVHFFLMKLINEDEVPTPEREENEHFANLWLPIEDAREKLTHEANKELLGKV